MSLKSIKLSVPKYDEVVPTTGKRVEITPFRVGDEKTLLIAAQSESVSQMTKAMREIVINNTSENDYDQWQAVDYEYMFVKIRAKSVGETSTIGVPCDKCGSTNKLEIDLTSVSVSKNEKHSNHVKIEKSLAFEMKSVDPEDMEDIDFADADSMLNLIVKSIKTVYTSDESIEIDSSDFDDLKTLINSMTTEQFNTMSHYFNSLPKLVKEIDFTCGECGEHNERQLSGISSFF